MSHPKPITIVTDDGPFTLPSIRAACKFLNYSRTSHFYRDIQKLRNTGLTYDEAMTKLYKHRMENRANGKCNNSKPITIRTSDGSIVFPSIVAVLRAMGKGKKAADPVLRRFRAQGRSDDDAMTAYWNDPTIASRTAISLNGVQYDSVRDACDKLHIKHQTICQMAANKSISTKDALLLYLAHKPKRRGIPCTVNDITYDSISAACRAFGYSYGAVRSAAKTRGIEPAQVLSEWAAANRVVHANVWTEAEDNLVRRYYPVFGTSGILSYLFKDAPRSMDAVQVHATHTLKLKATPTTTTAYVIALAYQTNDGHFFYWYYCKRHNAFMLLSADEVVDYVQSPSSQFCHEHTVPQFVRIPRSIMNRATNQTQSYQVWLAGQ